MKRRVGLIVWAIASSACASAVENPDGGACPAELASKPTWVYSGDNALCKTFAEAANESDNEDDSDSTDPCAVPSKLSMVDDGQTCSASAELSCETIKAKIGCTVEPNGEADCTAQIDLNVENTALRCDLSVEFR